VDTLSSPVINVAHLPISNSAVIPGTCCYGNWIKDVRAGQLLGDLVAAVWLAAVPASVAVSPMCDSA